MTLRKTAQLTAGALAAAVMLVGVPTPASAGQGFSIQTPWQGWAPGAAAASGGVSFPGAQTVHVNSDVRDICPQDGYGAYLNLSVEYMDGQVSTTTINQDTNGCGPAWVSGSRSFSYPKNIRKVHLTILEYNQGGSVADSRSTSWIDNPRT